MPYTGMERKSLETVRAQERVRIEAIRKNDADAMNGTIDDKFIYRARAAKLNSSLRWTLLLKARISPAGTGASMSGRPHRTHSAAFKAKVALAAVRDDRTRTWNYRLRVLACWATCCGPKGSRSVVST